MKILFVGDIVSKTGRRVVQDNVLSLYPKYDFVIANAENTTQGRGVGERHGKFLQELPIDCFTGGNHSMDNEGIRSLWESSKKPFLVPINLPKAKEFRGKHSSCILEKKGFKLEVFNLLGNSIFPEPEAESPFQVAEKFFQTRDKSIPLIIDFHAETTSEKNAFPWFCDGRANAVLGTHFHVPTADAKILPKGTAMITDTGMCGCIDTVIGVDPDIIVNRLAYNKRASFHFKDGRGVFRAVEIEIHDKTLETTGIRQIIIEESDEL